MAENKLHFFIRLLLITTGTVLVFFYAADWLKVKRADLKIEITAQILRNDQFMLEYDYTPGKRTKNRRVIQYRKNIEASANFQTFTFPVPGNPSIKRIGLYAGKNTKDILIKSIRFTSISPHYQWKTKTLLRAAQKAARQNSGFQVQEDQNRIRLTTAGPKQNNAGQSNAPCLILDNNISGKNIRDIYYYIAGHKDRKDMLKLPAAGIAVLSYFIFHFLLPSDFSYLTRRIASIGKGTRKIHVSRMISVVLFAVIVFFPTIFMLTGSDSSIDNAEKRGLAKLPPLQLSKIWEFPAKYRQYFNDHFPFRGPFIRFNNVLKVKVYKTSPIPKVIVGKNGWLFYRSELENDGNTIQDYQGNLLFTEAELKRIKKNIERKIAQCKRANTHLLIILVPNKETIYSELMPVSIKKGKTNRFHQLKTLCQKNPHLPVMFLTDALMEKKKERRIFYTGGTHWNQYGAFYGYEAIMKRLEKDFPQLKPYPLEAFDVTLEKDSAYDHWFGFKEHRHFLLSLKEPLPQKFREGREKLKCVAFRDSFFMYFPHFYQYHFEPFLQVSNHGYNHQLIKAQKPDVVIWEIIERSTHLLLEKK